MNATTATTPKLHLSLDVRDLDQSIAFYSALFNTTPTKVKPGYAKFDLQNPWANLTLQQAPFCCIGGINHLGIRVDSTAEVLAMKQRLEQAGIRTEDEMNTTCCYAVQDKIWIADPTGYRWEVYVFKGDSEQAMARSTEPTATAACCS